MDLFKLDCTVQLVYSLTLCEDVYLSVQALPPPSSVKSSPYVDVPVMSLHRPQAHRHQLSPAVSTTMWTCPPYTVLEHTIPTVQSAQVHQSQEFSFFNTLYPAC